MINLQHQDYFLDFLKDFRNKKEEEGFVPTVDLLIEELEKADEDFGDNLK